MEYGISYSILAWDQKRLVGNQMQHKSATHFPLSLCIEDT